MSPVPGSKWQEKWAEIDARIREVLGDTEEPAQKDEEEEK